MSCRLVNPEVFHEAKTYIRCCECGRWFPSGQDKEETKRRTGELVCSMTCFSEKVTRQEVELLQSLVL